MSSSSSDAPEPAGSRRAGLFNRVWGALTGRTGTERIATLWGLDANGQPTRKAPLRRQADAPAMPERSQADRIYLTVPYAEKDQVKALGARFDGSQRSWYVPAGVNKAPFEAWLPDKAKPADPVAEFADAMRRAGLRVEQPEMDGKLHRVQVEGDKGAREKSGAYVGHLDGWPAGFYQNFKTGGDKVNWKASGRPVAALSAQERTQIAADAAQKTQDRAREREGLHGRTAERVGAMWAAAMPTAQHPYLTAKGVGAHGLRQGAPGQTVTVNDQGKVAREVSVSGQLFVPVRDTDGKLSSLQFIRQDGSKMFMADGRVDGGHHVIGDPARPGPLLITEGFATAATVHELTGHTAIAAFNAGNLSKVALAYRGRFPDRVICLAGDNDHAKEAEGKPNVGREKAEAAAAAIGGHALVPAFPTGAKGSDWNDLAQSQGREATQLALLGAIRIAEREHMVASMGAARLSGRAAFCSPELTRAGQEQESAGHER